MYQHDNAARRMMIAALAALALASGGAQAAAITTKIAPRIGGTAGTVDSVSVTTTAEGNDVAANGFRSTANRLTIYKTFTDPTPGRSIDIEFSVECDAGACDVTEYSVTEFVTNGTPRALTLGMSQLTVALGFGGVRSGESFALSENDDGLDFDQEAAGSGAFGIDDPFPSSNVFAACDLCSTGDRLFFKNGVLLPGQTAQILYQLDVPEVFMQGGTVTDPIFNIPDGFFVSPVGQFTGGYRFTLSQYAEFQPVPIPPALVLFGPAVVALGGLHRRRR